MMTDPIADLLTRIRNINRLGRSKLSVPYSKMKEAIVAVLLREGFIESFEVSGEGIKREINIVLKFTPSGTAVITSIQRISKPGRRVYRGIKDLDPVLRGMGIDVLSTPNGIITDREARKQGVGGEILCRVY